MEKWIMSNEIKKKFARIEGIENTQSIIVKNFARYGNNELCELLLRLSMDGIKIRNDVWNDVWRKFPELRDMDLRYDNQKKVIITKEENNNGK